MAITPVSISATGVDVWHSERQHGGTIAWADVNLARRPDGTEHLMFIVLACPVAGCDSVSVHPVSGGADRTSVREMFARYVLRRATALGLDVPNLAAARDWVRQRAIELDGDKAG